jgi:hypothetical protein
LYRLRGKSDWYDLSNRLGEHAREEAHAMIFVKNVYDAYEIETKQEEKL